MTVEDFITKTVPLLRSATSVPGFIDAKTAILATSVVDQLSALKNKTMMSLVLADPSLRTHYIGLLQNMNAVARATNNSKVQDWVSGRVVDLMDKMCAYPEVGQSFKSPASSEFEF